ncbi:seryl-tRNA synthetase [Auricularia subglabra TFB-10046 SS5]|nr:seryl-tRNA synthetase [Auricularia subglabra TFB-10046 SS5]
MLPRICKNCRRATGFARLARRYNHSLPQRNSQSVTVPGPRLDYRGIAENVVFKSHNAFNRKSGMPVGTVQNVEQLYKQSRDLESELNRRRAVHNAMISRVKDANKKERAALIEDARQLKAAVQEVEQQMDALDSELYTHASLIPNDTHVDVPIGPESAANILSQHGPEPLPASPERDHVQIAKHLNLVDFDSGALSTGASWYYLINEGAQLELALTNYAFSVALKRGFRPALTPDVVKADVAWRCGFQPRDDSDPPVHHMYHVQNSDLVLTGTAEIPLAALFANRVLDGDALPVRVAGLGRAFRSEAGARGADTRGLYRVHQFSKVELFAVTAAEQSEDMLDELKQVQIELFSGLGLTFRVLDMPTEELGASAYRKYDMEAWMPGRGKWGEISSTSNCTDYQARRLHIRYTNPSQSQAGRSNAFAHTLNGTAAAVPRLIIALLENGAVLDDAGQVTHLNLPKTLAPFWVGGADNAWLSANGSANGSSSSLRSPRFGSLYKSSSSPMRSPYAALLAPATGAEWRLVDGPGASAELVSERGGSRARSSSES